MGDARLFVRGAPRLAEPMHDGEFAACRLAGSVALLLDVRGEVRPTPRPMGGLRELLAADESAAEIIGATVDDSAAASASIADELTAVNGALKTRGRWRVSRRRVVSCRRRRRPLATSTTGKRKADRRQSVAVVAEAG